MDLISHKYALPTVNGNANMVLAMLHRFAEARHGLPFADGLASFGVSMLFGIEPRVFLIAPWFPYEELDGRRANDDATPSRYASYTFAFRDLQERLDSGHLID